MALHIEIKDFHLLALNSWRPQFRRCAVTDGPITTLPENKEAVGCTCYL